MKNIVLRSTVVLAMSAIMISCGKEAKKETTEENTEVVNETPADVVIDPKVDLNVTDSSSKVVFAEASLNEVYTNYLRVKSALVNSDNALVMKTATQMNNAIEDAEATKQLKATAELISVTKDINKQRDFFVTLTAEVEKMIKGAEITSGEVYKQYCPMAFDGKGGYWLSNSKEVRNPYYGNKMLKCGSVEETIN